jgi:hypothetical protein
MTLYDIIRIYGFAPSDFRFVRHGYAEIDPLKVFKGEPELFNAYQSLQVARKFGDSNYIASFSPYHGTQGLFLGVWRIDNEAAATTAPPGKLALTERFGWRMENMSYYTLTRVDAFDDLSERLIIEWGGSTVSWVQKKDKEVLCILQPAHVQEFQSFEHTVLDREALVKMVNNPTNNATWYNALRSVNGIYCITDTSNGKLYIGSTYGKNGLWGRWSNYATTGHGGNKLLADRLQNDPAAVNYFQYSILEILPGSSTADDAVAKEILWKQKLGSQINGYNDN